MSTDLPAVTTTPKIEVGQIWERVSGGAQVRVTHYHDRWDDVRWTSIVGKRSGAIYGCNFTKRYRLVSGATS